MGKKLEYKTGRDIFGGRGAERRGNGFGSIVV